MTPFPFLVLQVGGLSPLERTVAVVADVATIVIAVALIAVGAVAIYGSRRAKAAIGGVRADLAPALRSITAAAEQVEAMSRTARAEVDRVGAAFQSTTERVVGATERAAERLRELDALLVVAQAEAEEAFVRTAAAVRGVQAGTRALRGRPDGSEEGAATGSPPAPGGDLD